MAYLKIERDGRYYVIEMERAGSGEQTAAILEQDARGWHLLETWAPTPQAQRLTMRIGRRKHWQDALATALHELEALLANREARRA